MNVDMVMLVHQVTTQLLQQRALIAQLQADCLALKQEVAKLKEELKEFVRED